MEAAIRWSPHSTEHTPRFLIVDVAGARLRLCQIEQVDDDRRVRYKQVAVRDKLPSYTAFDWSKTHEHFVAVGSVSGEATLVQIDAERPSADFIHSFSVKHQRKCNSIAFSTRNLLATGLDRVRNDNCMNIYDLNTPGFANQQEPLKKLATSEAITSIKFFSRQPDTLVAGVARQCIRLYDIRDAGGTATAQFSTRQVHNIAIDPQDENYVISAGPAGDPTVNVWDIRYISRLHSNATGDGSHGGPVLEMRPSVDNSQGSTVWSLRYSGTRRGRFGILSSSGEMKVVELAQHEMRSTLGVGPINQLGGFPWQSSHYVRRSHSLQSPWYKDEDEAVRAIAYDFVSCGNPRREDCVVALHPTREVELINIPQAPPHVDFTVLNELYGICAPEEGHVEEHRALARPRSANESISSDLKKLQDKVKDLRESRHHSNQQLNGDSDTFGKARQEPPKTIVAQPLSSREAHEQLLKLWYPEVHLELPDILTFNDRYKRRAKEGYMLGCKRNKQVVSNNPWLVHLWEIVGRMEAIARDEGMVAHGLDLSYLGIQDIWSNYLPPTTKGRNRLVGTNPQLDKSNIGKTFINAVKTIHQKKELPPFTGVATKHPEHRQLCLTLCGWNVTREKLRRKSMKLIAKGECYKAIVRCVFKGHKDIALDLLKQAVKKRLLTNIGLGAVIACDTVNDEQRDMCSWMSDETDDPYLKSLLAYFVTSNWDEVVKTTQLPLSDRVAVALRYLDDRSVGSFIREATSEAVKHGDIEGIVLTGLGSRAMDLFERYISRFGDLQTAVLTMARTNPLYLKDDRWALWHETYLFQMQSWRAFLERARFLSSHNMLAQDRAGRCLNPQLPRQMTIRCNNCQLSLARRGDELVVRGEDSNGNPLFKNSNNGNLPPAAAPQKKNASAKSPNAAAGLVCPRCGAHMPRCGICMMWLGTPDPAKPGGAAALALEDPKARQIIFCINCAHGFHGHHARDWFTRHSMCPVPDCQCMCGVLR